MKALLLNINSERLNEKFARCINNIKTLIFKISKFHSLCWLLSSNESLKEIHQNCTTNFQK